MRNATCLKHWTLSRLLIMSDIIESFDIMMAFKMHLDVTPRVLRLLKLRALLADSIALPLVQDEIKSYDYHEINCQ